MVARRVLVVTMMAACALTMGREPPRGGLRFRPIRGSRRLALSQTLTTPKGHVIQVMRTGPDSIVLLPTQVKGNCFPDIIILTRIPDRIMDILRKKDKPPKTIEDIWDQASVPWLNPRGSPRRGTVVFKPLPNNRRCALSEPFRTPGGDLIRALRIGPDSIMLLPEQVKGPIPDRVILHGTSGSPAVMYSIFGDTWDKVKGFLTSAVRLLKANLKVKITTEKKTTEEKTTIEIDIGTGGD